MIPIINSKNQTEFHLIARKKLFFSNNKIASVSFYDGENNDAYEIKAFISDIFYRFYKAKIKVGFPHLLSVMGVDKTILAAVGFRSAGESELFLEQYLDDRVENIIFKITGEKISRSQIVEIGSLASDKKGMARFLYIAIATYVYSKNYRYVVATGTEFLQKYFKKAGLKPIILCAAKQEKLRNKDVDWGSYYNSNPKVMLLNVTSGYRILKLFLGIKVVPSFEKLYPNLSYE